MSQLEKDVLFTIELIDEYPETNYLGIDYYLCVINYEREGLTKAQEQSLVNAIRRNPAIRTPENYKHYFGRYMPSRDKSFLAPETWLPDSE